MLDKCKFWVVRILADVFLKLNNVFLLLIFISLIFGFYSQNLKKYQSKIIFSFIFIFICSELFFITMLGDNIYFHLFKFTYILFENYDKFDYLALNHELMIFRNLLRTITSINEIVNSLFLIFNFIYIFNLIKIYIKSNISKSSEKINIKKIKKNINIIKNSNNYLNHNLITKDILRC